MMKKKVSFLIFLGLCLLCLFQAWYYYPLLPDHVASHFGPTGHPDAWTTKVSFFHFCLIVIAGLALLFSLIGLLMAKIPVQLMSLPNKDYWMAAERRQATLDELSFAFFWFASATMILLLDMFYQTFQVQLGKAKILTHPVLSLGIYISFSIILTAGLLIRFLRRDNAL
jgi:uncharacterized membrane protein